MRVLSFTKVKEFLLQFQVINTTRQGIARKIENTNIRVDFSWRLKVDRSVDRFTPYLTVMKLRFFLKEIEPVTHGTTLYCYFEVDNVRVPAVVQLS